MSSLHTLLKIAQRKLDELGGEAGRIQGGIDQLRMAHSALLARKDVEVANAQRDLAFAPMLPAYLMRVKAQGGAIQTQIAEREATLSLVRQRLTAAYQEKSKFEQLIEQERIRLALERAEAEQKQLDEVAINRASRA